MKINAQRLSSYLCSAYDGTALLIFGPHQTFNEEYARAITAIVAQKKGLSAVCVPTFSQQTLADIISPQPMLFQGDTPPRIPLLHAIKDSDTSAIVSTLSLCREKNIPLICTSSSLNTRSKLVNALNDESSSHAVGVYDSTPSVRIKLLTAFADFHHLNIPTKIVSFLAERTNEDSNLEDLTKKVGLLIQDNADVLPSQIATLIGDLSVEVDDLIWAFWENTPSRFAKLNDYLNGGGTIIPFIRGCLRLGKQMFDVRTNHENGQSLSAAIAALRPAPLFTVKTRFENVCRDTTARKFITRIAALNTLEAETKLSAELTKTRALRLFSMTTPRRETGT